MLVSFYINLIDTQWYRYSHLTLGKKAKKPISPISYYSEPNMETLNASGGMLHVCLQITPNMLSL